MTPTVKAITGYLMERYYPRYKGKGKLSVPDENSLFTALDVHKDKIVVVHDDGDVCGVALFLTLTDVSYEKLESLDMEDLDVMAGLLDEKGPHIHFILLSSEGTKVILSGLKAVIKERDPKTISWWDPEHNRLHRFRRK